MKSLQRIKATKRNQRLLFCALVNANESSISNYPVLHACRIAAGSARLYSNNDNRECKTPQKLIQATLIRLQASGCHNRECKTHRGTSAQLQHCKHDILAFLFTEKSLERINAKKRNQRFLFCAHVNENKSRISDYPVRHVCRIAAASARLHRNRCKQHCKHDILVFSSI